MQRVSTPGCTPAVDAMVLALALTDAASAVLTTNNVTSIIAAIAASGLTESFADNVVSIVAATGDSSDTLKQLGNRIARALPPTWGDGESVVSNLRKLLSLLLGVVQRTAHSALGRLPALEQAKVVFAALKRGFPRCEKQVDDFFSTLARNNSRETATAVSTLVSDIESIPGVLVGHQVAALVALIVLMAAYASSKKSKPGSVPPPNSFSLATNPNYITTAHAKVHEAERADNTTAIETAMKHAIDEVGLSMNHANNEEAIRANLALASGWAAAGRYVIHACARAKTLEKTKPQSQELVTLKVQIQRAIKHLRQMVDEQES